MTNKSQGNVLFLLLIAVALFAALSYAVTSSTRTGGSSISKDKAKANAAAIIQYGTSLRNAIMRMKISNGCTDTTLDFSNSIYKNNGGLPLNSVNTNAPASKVCNLFDGAGGGAVPVISVAEALDLTHAHGSLPGAFKFGHLGIRIGQLKGVGTDGAAGTASANDFVLFQPYLTKDTCIAINDLLGVTNPSENPPAFDYSGALTGYVNGDLTSDALFDNAATNGQPAFCYMNSAAAYIYIMALIER